VGNKAAVFPLQLLGFDVDVVNSVHFSNHTGYKQGVEGDVLKGDQLRDILSGLERNGLLTNVGTILTGYIGSESFLEAVLDVVERVRQNSKTHFRYVCDPVLGDDGRFYVPSELVDVYKRRVIPIADVLTPNQFEVEKLTGITITNFEDAKKACRRLHDMGPSLVVITSLLLRDESAAKESVAQNPAISVVASQKVKATNDSDSVRLWRISCPVLPGRYTGTGDLFAALLLAHTSSACNDSSIDIPSALEQVVNTMYAVIERTHAHSQTFPDISNPFARELQLIQSKKEIESPPKRFRAVPCDE